MSSPRHKRPRGFADKKSGYSAPRRGALAKKRPERLLQVPPMTLLDGTVRFVLKVGAKGRVLLPADLRSELGLGEGDTILGWLKDGELRLESQARTLQRIQEEGRRRRGDRSVVDEFIAERRAAAARGE